MRLLNVSSLDFTEFRDDNRPPYVAASHRWLGDDEATFQDVRDRRNTDGKGYQKVKEFAVYIQRNLVPVKWLWIDTCCINKESAVELSEAINLMFEWYNSAELCLAYLADVATGDGTCTIEKSEWFERGWTLQELLAPQTVLFVTEKWDVVGHKGSALYGDCRPTIGSNLEKRIAQITGIPEKVLHNYEASTDSSVAAKVKWIEGRKTTRPEDMSYALFGILGVTPGANYGEGAKGATQRLMAAIAHRDNVAAQQAEHYRKIAAWLASPDPRTNHESARQLHQPHTGTWLVESAQYQNWKAASIRHLWMYGKAGCGKTILCSTAIVDMKAHCERHPGAGYAIFYFSFSDNKKQRLVHLLGSLVVQLGWKGPALSILQQAYDRPNRTMLGLDELESILITCFQSYNEVFLLVDALDESPEDGDVRHEMFECLARLSQKVHQVKIFATSRELPDIRQSMASLGAEPIAIAVRLVDEDIRRYMARQLSRDHRLSRLDLQTKALIEETISVQADGMFRWAYCQLQELRKLKGTKPKYIKETLRNLPATLDATYDRMLSKIEDLYHKEAIVLLQWLAYAQSPPSLSELVDAAIIDPTEEGCVATDERGGLEDTLEILSGLVVVLGINAEDYESKDGGQERDHETNDRESDSTPSEMLDHKDIDTPAAYRYQRIRGDTKVRLAHFSVKEYLESKRILQSGAKMFYLEGAIGHRFLAQSCLTYIMHYSRSSEKLSTTQDLVVFPLLQYAARSWFHHSSQQDVGEAACEVSLLSNKDTMHDWLHVYQPDRGWETPFGHMTETGSGLYYASFIGLKAVVIKLLGIGAETNAQRGRYGNALQAASYGGHEKVVQMLVDAGAWIDAQGGEYGNALQAASCGGHEKVVQMLLNTGARVNAQGGRYGTALQAASHGGHGKVVQTLVDAGAEVNATGGRYGNALQGASFQGHEKVVQMLLDAGAEIDAQGGEYGNALQAASFRGHEQVVQMLLDAEAEVNAQDRRCGNAPRGQSFQGHEKVVQMLVVARAGVDAQGGRYGNALQAASFSGHEKVVQMLLTARAEVNAQEGRYGNALQAASCGGHEKVVQMLLDAGAEVGAQGGEYGNALQAASYLGHEKVVQMLLDAGAEVDAHGQWFGSALQVALERGHEKVVQMLLDARAEVDTQGGQYGNALQAASFQGHEKVVQVLLDAGAEVDAQGGEYGNALQAASYGGHEKVVQMLLDAGAEVDEQGGWFGSALQAALERGHEQVVQILLDARPEIEAQGGRYSNAP
ncbi:hypothetical protein LTR56_027692 [Elasticomyces elasticus]|nr:hypothetical protein LTR56_027692 [Elasticomyces elasticus]KAK4904510.1 hypothetical protein LTR49_026051 [Elasticomyces elasticus]